MTKTPGFFLGTALAFFVAGSVVNFNWPPALAQSTLQELRNGAEFSLVSKAEPVNDRATIPASVLPAGGVFPSVEIIRYSERPGIARGVVVTLRVTNKGPVSTDAVSLSLKDANTLLRPSRPVNIPSLRPGASRVLTANLEAELSSSDSQTPTATSAWRERYRASCGPELHSVMDSFKIQERAHPQGPVSAHQERSLPVIASTSGYQKADPYVSICDSVQCLKPCVMVKEIQKQLDGHVVGYSFFAGLNSSYTSYGYARTAANGTAEAFTPDTKVPVASVSKLVTAIAAVRILARNGVKLDDPIGPYLPDDWSVNSMVKDITFAQLLSQTSGVKDYGNVNTNDRKLKEYFSQPITQTSLVTTCTKAKYVDPPHSLNPSNHDFCYSNYNFAIFRILLPRVVTKKITGGGQWIADKYVSLVQGNVFDLVGRPNVECKPPSSQAGVSNYAYAYRFPGTSAGAYFGDETLKCGGAGWVLSARDLARVLLSINALDGKILSETSPDHQFDDMRNLGLGWGDVGPRELQKDGGYGANCDSNGENCAEISTVAAIFGPVTGPRFVALLFMNSNVSGGPSNDAKAPEVILKAYNNSLYPK
ncbi:MAG TPA: serine hydrolase domain-containing protein [Pyrinomonadaceae bacterium]|jgi:CubicO group peptidase (beta-lactamase class C family)|nr:serine hydrolase domain-containing protein [Pyrinomonadaceae bacterium]